MRALSIATSLLALRILRATALALALGATQAHAQVKVDNAWVRGAVPGQLATGAFLDITSTRDAALVKAESPIAATVEVHAMEMKNNLMTMREAPKIDLPAGKQVRLAPGGFHIMLMDLKQPVKNGEMVPIRLTIEYPDKKRETVDVQAQVRGLGTSQEHQHKH
jgi:copper(I)-binding protein